MPVPPGWEPKLDPSSGKTYFWNTVTNATQWERPTELADPVAMSRLMLRQAAAAAADFVRCPESVGAVPGYDHRDGEDGVGYYRRGDAPAPDDAEYSRLMLMRASAAGAGFVGCPTSVGEVQGYQHRRGPDGPGYYLLPGQRDVACEAPAQDAAASSGAASSSSSAMAAASLPTAEEVSRWMKQHQVEISDGCPPPVITFAAARLLPELLQTLEAAGFSQPSPIQAASWSPAVAGRDVVAIAKTGSGKTLGYLAPAIGLIAADPSLLVMSQPTALVLAPTRELATQITAECERFGGSSGIASVCLYGGAPRAAQLAELEKGVHVVVATPGRLNDFIDAGQVELDEARYVVLDEADRMLDMGFEPQIREALKQVPRGSRQTLMFSATWPTEVQALAADFLRKPCKVTIGGSGGGALVVNQDVEQRIVFTHTEAMREAELAKQIRLHPTDARAIVFCSTKKSCEAVARTLRRLCSCAAIHGDKEQHERDKAIADFKSGAIPVLVATDVAARGLDIAAVGMVVNYEMPSRIEDYVHRVGRTGRAGAKGYAVSFMGAADAKHAPAILKLLKEAGQKPPVELAKMAKIIGGSK